MTSHKREYSQGLLKDVEESGDAEITAWASAQPVSFLESLLHWYEDAYKYGLANDDRLLLNLDRKDDIMAVIAVHGPAFVRDRISLLLEALESLRKFVQPGLVMEHVLSVIGG